MTAGIVGLKVVLGNMRKAHQEIKQGQRRGLTKAGLIIKREAMKRTPVDLGNLKGSAYSDLDPYSGKFVEIGYTAEYAPIVHEDLEARHTVGEAKFLERAVNAKRGEALDVIGRESKVG